MKKTSAKENLQEEKIKIYIILGIIGIIGITLMSYGFLIGGFLISLCLPLLAWIEPEKNEPILDRLKNFHKFKRRNIITLILFLPAFIVLLSSLVSYIQTSINENNIRIEETKKNNTQKPEINIITDLNREFTVNELVLEYSVLNADEVYFDDKITSSTNNKYSQIINLTNITTTGYIKASNKYWDTGKEIIITRAKTTEEIQNEIKQKAIEEQKRAEEEKYLNSSEYKTKLLEDKLNSLYIQDKEKKSGLIVWCKMGVEKLLKSPKSADFPWTDWVFEVKGDKVFITSYVDSENSFGANIRTHFQCIMKRDGEDLIMDDIKFE